MPANPRPSREGCATYSTGTTDAARVSPGQRALGSQEDTESVFEDEPALAWKAMPYHAVVMTADGKEVGTAESLLGDEEEDIFHGIAVKAAHGRMVEIAANRIKKITARGVATDISEDEVTQLEPYREEKWFHIGWGGLFRKHPEWKSR
jgi:hypothetical protein